MTGKSKRQDKLFSLCGLNCSLCPLLVQGNCQGCQDGSHCASVCSFAPCSVEHGDVDYCFECGEYPCEKYDGVDEYDSLISHKNQLKDMQKAKGMGIEAYHREQMIKKQFLSKILKNYDDGHRLVFYCMAVNLMDTDDLKNILIYADNASENMDLSEKSDLLKKMLCECASKRGIELKLRLGRW